MTIETKLKALLDDFSSVSDDKERVQVMMEFGEELEQPNIDFQDDEKVPGCASEVFVRVELKENKVSFQMWSTSLIIKGYCELLKQILAGENKESILNSKEVIARFIKDAHLDASLIPSRTNSFERLYSFILDNVKKV